MKEGIEKEIVSWAKEEIKQPFYRITDKFAKPAISLYLIQSDLEEISNCITKAEGFIDKDELLLRSVWKNAVVTYGKIFAKSKDGFTSLEKSDCISEKYLDIHNELIALRNSFIAHRGDNEVENSMLLAYEQKENGFVGFEYTITTATQIGHLTNDIELIKGLISDLKIIVENKLNKKLKGIDTLLWMELVKAGTVKPKK